MVREGQGMAPERDNGRLVSGAGHTGTMTEQEAEVWAARLTRIWELTPHVLDWSKDPRYSRNLGQGYIFKGSINADVSFVCWPGQNIFRIMSRQFDTVLSCSEGVFSAWRYPPDERDVSPCPSFTTQWLPFFRRRCWLSGCPIEASAHEKAEWIQGFSRKEIEAWNLKF